MLISFVYAIKNGAHLSILLKTSGCHKNDSTGHLSWYCDNVWQMRPRGRVRGHQEREVTPRWPLWPQIADVDIIMSCLAETSSQSQPARRHSARRTALESTVYKKRSQWRSHCPFYLLQQVWKQSRNIIMFTSFFNFFLYVIQRKLQFSGFTEG